jgi:hypothetical protein
MTRFMRFTPPRVQEDPVASVRGVTRYIPDGLEGRERRLFDRLAAPRLTTRGLAGAPALEPLPPRP